MLVLSQSFKRKNASIKLFDSCHFHPIFSHNSSAIKSNANQLVAKNLPSGRAILNIKRGRYMSNVPISITNRCAVVGRLPELINKSA